MYKEVHDLGHKLPLKISVVLKVLNVIFQQQQKIMKKKEVPFSEDKQEKIFCQMLHQIVVLLMNAIEFIYLHPIITAKLFSS